MSSDPVGLWGGLNTYSYADTNPLSNYDPSGLRCLGGVGCWTTPSEQMLLNNGDYLGYYQWACAGSDTYACFAGHIAANDTVMSHAVTDWLHIHLYFSAGNKHGCGGQPAVLDHIRLDLARDYAAYLPNSESQARWPNATDVAHFHWQEFAKYGLPPSTFGGTPFGDRTWFPWYWCPNCR